MSLDPTRDDPDVTLDLPSVAKHNWKSKDHRDEWSDDLGKFPRAFGRAAEAALTDDDHPRSALTRTLDTDDAFDLVSRLPDAVDVARKSGDERTTVALVGPTCEYDAQEVLDGDCDPVAAQTARGVPECCAEQYDADRERGLTDPVAAIAKRTESTTERGGELVVESPHPILNLAWSYMGWRFVDFYPCSFECDRAREVAVETGRLLRETGHETTAEATFEFLAGPTHWSGYHGLAHVKNGWCIGEYTTDEYWSEEIVRFNGYHEELAGSESEGC